MAAAENFRLNLRTALDARGISQLEVARRIGVSGPYVNRVLQGHTEPGLANSERLARAAGFPLVALLDSPENFQEAVLTASIE